MNVEIISSDALEDALAEELQKEIHKEIVREMKELYEKINSFEFT